MQLFKSLELQWQLPFWLDWKLFLSNSSSS